MEELPAYRRLPKPEDRRAVAAAAAAEMEAYKRLKAQRWMTRAAGAGFVALAIGVMHCQSPGTDVSSFNQAAGEITRVSPGLNDVNFDATQGELERAPTTLHVIQDPLVAVGARESEGVAGKKIGLLNVGEEFRIAENVSLASVVPEPDFEYRGIGLGNLNGGDQIFGTPVVQHIHGEDVIFIKMKAVTQKGSWLNGEFGGGEFLNAYVLGTQVTYPGSDAVLRTPSALRSTPENAPPVFQP